MPGAILKDTSSPVKNLDEMRFESPAYRGPATPGNEKEAALRDLAIRLINAQEEERSRIARELHDDLSQKIALLAIQLEQLGQMFEGPESLRQCYLNLQTQIQEISVDIYQLSYRLHPSKLEHLGLAAAINGLCQQFTSSGQLKVEFYQEEVLSNLPQDVTLCVFRIAQEALRNSAKHGGSERARVVLINTGDEVRLTVSDEGRGFEMTRETMERGLGFTSMRERLMVVGGTITIRSKAGRGTLVEVSIPLE